MLGVLLCFDLHSNVASSKQILQLVTRKSLQFDSWRSGNSSQKRLILQTHLVGPLPEDTNERLGTIVDFRDQILSMLAWNLSKVLWEKNALVWSRCAVCGRGAKSLTFSVLISYSDRRKGKRSCYVGLFQMDYIGVSL